MPIIIIIMQYIILSYTPGDVKSFRSFLVKKSGLHDESHFLFFNYLTSIDAPTSSSLALSSSASSLLAPSLIAFGALSTSSFASLSPRPVISLTALITLIFSPPADARITSNSVFSSTAASAAAAGAAATAAGAAATGSPRKRPAPNLRQSPAGNGFCLSHRRTQPHFWFAHKWHRNTRSPLRSLLHGQV